MSSVEERIRAVLAEHARLPAGMDEVGDETDLFDAGMTSHASVNVMLAVEDEFDLEFPERMLRKGTFESVVAIRDAVVELGAGG